MVKQEQALRTGIPTRRQADLARFHGICVRLKDALVPNDPVIVADISVAKQIGVGLIDAVVAFDIRIRDEANSRLERRGVGVRHVHLKRKPLRVGVHEQQVGSTGVVRVLLERPPGIRSRAHRGLAAVNDGSTRETCRLQTRNMLLQGGPSEQNHARSRREETCGHE